MDTKNIEPVFNLSDFNSVQEIVSEKKPMRTSWIIALDIGFSAVKAFAPNKRFCFPSFVRKIDQPLSATDPNDICYRDEGGTYLVGINAQDLVQADDTNDTNSFFDRSRYYNRDFAIILRVALAIGLMDNEVRKRHPSVRPFIQTGLPAAYVKEDAPLIRSTFTEPCKYEVRIGSGEWLKFENTIKEKDVAVMSQPAGTMSSLMVGDDGNYREDAKAIGQKNILIADIGFGTFDPYGVKNRRYVLRESISDMGMKKILETASEAIYNDFRVDIRIPQMRKYIKEGGFRFFEVKKKRGIYVKLDSYIQKASKTVAEEAIEKLYEMAGYFKDYDILVMTGGTGAAWFPYFKEAFADIPCLTVIPGNYGSDLPVYYANARGYYMAAYVKSKAGGGMN